MSNTRGSKPLLFWLLILGAVALALFVIAKFLFPQIIKEFTALLVGLFAVVTGLVFRRNRKKA